MSANPEKRELSFNSFDDLLADARMLLERGYKKTGKWNLSQVCGHCANWIRYPMEGFPKPNAFVGMMLWLMKVTVAKGKLKKMLESGSMPGGQPTMPESIPGTSDMSDSDGVDQLAKTIEKFKTHKNDWHPSPLFGEIDTERLTKLNLIHSALHFSYLIPKE